MKININIANIKKSTSSVFFAAIFIAGLLSCDDKVRSLEDLSQPPSFLYFKKESTNWKLADPGMVIMDSAKVWSASNNASFPILIKLVNPLNNLSEISVKSSEPESQIFVNDNLYTSVFTAPNNEDLNLAFKSAIPSTQDFTIQSTEIFDKSNTLVCRIVFKPNRPPKADLKLVLVDGVTRNYQLNASGSYDIDSAIGGNVVEYQYIIDNVIINTSEPKINHIFTLGQHQLKLRVKDNDDVWSDYVSVALTVQ